MGKPFLIDLEGDVYSCKHCQTHLALAEDLISKDFHTPLGRAYRFGKVVNVSFGARQEETILPGLLSTIIDIYCGKCGTTLGWKYESAYRESVKYRLQIARSKILEPGEGPGHAGASSSSCSR